MWTLNTIYIYIYNTYIYIHWSWIGHPLEIIFASLSRQFNTHFWVCLKMGIRPKWQSSLETWWWTRGSWTIKHNLIKLKKCSMLLPTVMVLNSYNWDNPKLECFPIIFLSLCLFVKGYNCSWLPQGGELHEDRLEEGTGLASWRCRTKMMLFSWDKSLVFKIYVSFFSVGYLGIRFWYFFRVSDGKRNSFDEETRQCSFYF